MTPAGTQLSFLLQVPYSSLPDLPNAGDRITTSSGTASVTATEQVGQELVIWADYGSGIAHPHAPESLLPPEHTAQDSDRPSPAPSPLDPLKRKRRYSPKGKASGWIEERTGNKQRKTPSVSYYYRWEDGTRKRSTYIPARKLWRVQQMVEVEHRPIAEVLQFLGDR